MDVQKNGLKGSQLMVLIIGIVQGSTLLISFIDTSARQDTWFIAVSSVLVCIPFIVSYIYLAKRFPGKSLIEINDIVFGKVLGRVLSAFYFVFFLLILSFNLRDVADFYNGYIMPEMPQMVLLVVFALATAYAVKKGIRNIARLGLVTVVISFLIVIFTFILLIGNMDFSNFLPAFEIPGRKYVQATHMFATVPFGEAVVLLMVMQKTGDDRKRLTRCALLGLAVSFLFVILIIIRNTAVLGPSASIDTESSYEAVRMINLGDFLNRVELFIALGLTATLFIKISIFYYGAAASISQLLKLPSYDTLIIPIGGIAIILGITSYDSVVFHNDFGIRYHAMFALPFEFILPPLTLLIAKFRRLGTKKQPA